ncbi:hypothetical protein I302_108767 [Kwoniella bestiolae CBS 10118]|uniref:Uncharacterized protein n=1 Tax=Kwoniella bestiolae CBS 10118 TaxID=1296100 RepID=A0A1B9FU23_9TREE|nr:hypothetical protein I302_07904 [Kwoniella bestiolae CBS 10118]OCF22259.1 hypothetical protein I302_07904 [Kwoniella bestiolae CBS 10118]
MSDPHLTNTNTLQATSSLKKTNSTLRTNGQRAKKESNDKIKELKDANEALEDDLEAQLASAGDLERRNRDLDAENGELKAKIKELEDTIQLHHHNCFDEIDTLKKDNEDLEGELAQMRSRDKVSSEGNQAMKKDKERLESELAQAKSREKVSSEQNQALKNGKKDIRDEVAQIRTREKVSWELNQALQKELNAHQVQAKGMIASLERSNTALADKLGKVTEQVNVIKKAKKDLQRAVDEQSTELRSHMKMWLEDHEKLTASFQDIPDTSFMNPDHSPPEDTPALAVLEQPASATKIDTVVPSPNLEPHWANTNLPSVNQLPKANVWKDAFQALDDWRNCQYFWRIIQALVLSLSFDLPERHRPSVLLRCSPHPTSNRKSPKATAPPPLQISVTLSNVEIRIRGTVASVLAMTDIYSLSLKTGPCPSPRKQILRVSNPDVSCRYIFVRLIKLCLSKVDQLISEEYEISASDIDPSPPTERERWENYLLCRDTALRIAEEEKKKKGQSS